VISRHRLSLVAGPIAMVLLIATSGWVLWSGFERSKTASESVEHTYDVLIASESFLSSLREVESTMRAFVLSRDRRYLQTYERAVTSQARILNHLQQLTLDNPSQQSRLAKIRELADQRVAVLELAKKEVNEGRAAAMGRVVPLGEGPRLMEDLTAQVREFEGEERLLLTARDNAADEAGNWTRFLLILTSSLLSIVLLFAGVAAERYLRTRETSLEALQRQADLIDFSNDAVVTLDPDGVITGWNAGAMEVYGWSSAEALGRRAQEILKTEDPSLSRQIEESLAKTGRWDGELSQTTKDGRRCIVESRYVQVRNRAGAPVGVLNISRDQTQRRQEEELAQRVAEQRRLALEAARLGAWDYDVKQDRLTWDERCQDILGLTGFGPASFKEFMSIVHQDEREKMTEAAKRGISGQGEGRFAHEMRVRLPNRSVCWIAAYGRVYFDEARRPVRLIGVTSDITERKRVEEALRESEDKLRVALETGRIGIFNDIVSENRIVFDERAKQLLGVDGQQDVLVSDFLAMLHPDDRERMRKAREKDLQPAEVDPGELDYRIIHPNGQVRWLVARRRVYFDGDTAQRVLGVLLDITEQKQAEQRLTEALAGSDSERRRLSAILQTMPAGVVLADRNNKLLEANAEAVKIWRTGDFATLAERLSELKGWRAGTGERMRLEDWPRTRALKGETVLGEIIDVERFDGSKGTVFNSASPVRDANGVIQGVVGVMVDITEQRQIELALRRSEENLARLLEQKNILFQEVQHRVKNNLQIVSSLLSLEAQRFEDSEFHNALNESRDRIRSMALMHEKFYHLDDLARIDFSEYVEELARYFFSSYIADAWAIGFTSEVDVKLKMGDAIPCGLILQELLSNSVKHAFPEGKGEIRINFHEQVGRFILRYWDSGKGLPPTVDLHNPGTLGLTLVTDLANQLQGTIEYEYKQGSQFTLDFGGQ
jgi:PAS domain S-box-containing protein